MKWISVEDRLPKDGQDGVCADSFGMMALMLCWDNKIVESGNFCGRDFQHANGDMDYHDEPKVTHWMPLPEPPK